jgi:hypothetical protein
MRKAVGPEIERAHLIFTILKTTIALTLYFLLYYTSLAMSCSSTPKRSLRFADDDKLCVYHEGAVMDIEEICKLDIWYHHTDMDRMKRRAVRLCQETRRRCIFGSLLTNTYGKSCDATQDALNTWSRNRNSKRGLERWMNDEYAARRTDIRRRTVQSVLRAQDRMREESLTNPDNTVGVLSRVSEVFSKDSKTFSRAMGIADELAITVNKDEEQIRTMQKNVPLPIAKSPNSVFEVGITNYPHLELPFKKDQFEVRGSPFFL